MPNKPFQLSAKVVILDKDGRCLLLRRSPQSKNNAGKWDLPGGKVDAGEAFDAALLREVREETGLEIELERLLGAAESETPTPRVVYLILVGRHAAGRVLLSPEHDDCAWVAREELPQVDLSPQFIPFMQAFCRKGDTP